MTEDTKKILLENKCKNCELLRKAELGEHMSICQKERIKTILGVIGVLIASITGTIVWGSNMQERVGSNEVRITNIKEDLNDIKMKQGKLEEQMNKNNDMSKEILRYVKN